MFRVSLKMDHRLPFSNLSKQFPKAEMARWCNLEMDVLEINSPGAEGTAKIEKALRRMLKGLAARLVFIHRYSENSLEVIVNCKCALNNSSIAIIEASNCIPIMPITYKDGLERCSLLAFTKQDLKDALDNLGDVATVEIESQGTLARHSARPAMTISIDEFLGSLTSRQLGALVDALDMGYYNLPKKVTLDEIASRRKVPLSTFEEHFRKAEVKIMRMIRPYAKLAYLSGN